MMHNVKADGVIKINVKPSNRYISEAEFFGFNLLNKAQTNPKILAKV